MNQYLNYFVGKIVEVDGVFLYDRLGFWHVCAVGHPAHTGDLRDFNWMTANKCETRLWERRNRKLRDIVLLNGEHISNVNQYNDQTISSAWASWQVSPTGVSCDLLTRVQPRYQGHCSPDTYFTWLSMLPSLMNTAPTLNTSTPHELRKLT